MTIKTLRTSGGDYSTWDTMVAGVNALFQNFEGLLDDVDVRIQGGQTFGSDGAANASFDNVFKNAHNHTITIRTDPTEIATPAKILGQISITYNGDPDLNFVVKQVINYANVGETIWDFAGGNIHCLYEDIIVVVKAELRDDFKLSNISVPGYIDVNNCTIILTSVDEDTSSYLMAEVRNFTNNLILSFSSSALQLEFPALATNKNNTAYNYGGGSISFTVVGGTNPVLNTDPNLAEGAVITAFDESPATIIARDMKLTASSAACLDNADAGTAALVDIIGNSRS